MHGNLAQFRTTVELEKKSSNPSAFKFPATHHSNPTILHFKHVFKIILGMTSKLVAHVANLRPPQDGFVPKKFGHLYLDYFYSDSLRTLQSLQQNLETVRGVIAKCHNEKTDRHISQSFDSASATPASSAYSLSGESDDSGGSSALRPVSQPFTGIVQGQVQPVLSVSSGSSPLRTLPPVPGASVPVDDNSALIKDLSESIHSIAKSKHEAQNQQQVLSSRDWKRLMEGYQALQSDLDSAKTDCEAVLEHLCNSGKKLDSVAIAEDLPIDIFD